MIVVTELGASPCSDKIIHERRKAMKNIEYQPEGVCSKKINIVLDGDVIQSVKFEGGCNGNTQGVAALAQGMKVQDYINRCKGIKCGFKPTSCPDQLALALEKALTANA